jgi:transcription elongation GreA/GreB family factor
LEIKRFFVEQLKREYQSRIAAAGRAEQDAGEAADQIRSESTRREDAKSADMEGRLASGHRRRRRQAVTEMETLLDFAEKGIRRFPADGRVGLGALVDVRIEDEQGEEERTLFVLPVGAGAELNGPGGDGFVVVVTPRSPVGKALMGARVGDGFEIAVDGRDREWTIVDVG